MSKNESFYAISSSTCKSDGQLLYQSITAVFSSAVKHGLAWRASASTTAKHGLA
jgi:hypothetical protein